MRFIYAESIKRNAGNYFARNKNHLHTTNRKSIQHRYVSILDRITLQLAFPCPNLIHAFYLLFQRIAFGDISLLAVNIKIGRKLGKNEKQSLQAPDENTVPFPYLCHGNNEFTKKQAPNDLKFLSKLLLNSLLCQKTITRVSNIKSDLINQWTVGEFSPSERHSLLNTNNQRH